MDIIKQAGARVASMPHHKHVSCGQFVRHACPPHSRIRGGGGKGKLSQLKAICIVINLCAESRTGIEMSNLRVFLASVLRSIVYSC